MPDVCQVRVLLVDDDEDDRLLVSDLFEEIEQPPFIVEWAASYAEALTLHEQHAYDVYLLDFLLGEHTGMDLLRALLAAGCRAPILLLTSKGNHAIDLEAMNAGATDYLVKDRLSPETLERTMCYALARKADEEALREAHDALEKRVQERTLELQHINASLQEEIAERKQAEAALQKVRDELEARVQERTMALSISNELLELEIEQRKEWERELRASEKRHRTLLHAIPDAILQIDRDGTVLEYKPAYQNALSVLPSVLKGGSLLPLGDEALADALLNHVREALDTGRLLVFEYQLEAPAALCDLEIRIQPSGDAEALCIVRDVTERRKAERAKEEFISIVSHELRTPLTSIAGALALVATGATGTLPEMADNMIAVAHRNSERLIRLINDLLDLQKIEASTMPLHLRPVDVSSLVEQVLEANQAYADRYGVILDLSIPPNDVMIQADPDRLMQVLTNLVSNAVKFSPEGATVGVSVEPKRTFVRIAVQDDGPGIPEAFQDRIFQKFAQADRSSARAREGTGLGLSICRSIIEMHGGTIAFETAPDEGTTFFFELPMEPGDREHLAAPRRPEAMKVRSTST